MISSNAYMPEGIRHVASVNAWKTSKEQAISRSLPSSGEGGVRAELIIPVAAVYSIFPAFGMLSHWRLAGVLLLPPKLDEDVVITLPNRFTTRFGFDPSGNHGRYYEVKVGIKAHHHHVLQEPEKIFREERDQENRPRLEKRSRPSHGNKDLARR